MLLISPWHISETLSVHMTWTMMTYVFSIEIVVDSEESKRRIIRNHFDLVVHDAAIYACRAHHQRCTHDH